MAALVFPATKKTSIFFAVWLCDVKHEIQDGGTDESQNWK